MEEGNVTYPLQVPNSHTLTTLLDDAAILSLEHQIHLGEVLGEHDWNVDLREPRFEFTGARALTCERFHLLGSAGPGPRSWLWGWANPSGFPGPLTELGAAVRDFGHQHGIAELASPEIPFDALPGAPDNPNLVAGMLTEAAKALTGRWSSYTGDAGGGTRVAFLVEHRVFQLPLPEPTRLMGVLQKALAELSLTDPRRAVYAYASRRGLTTEFSPDGRLLTVGASGFEARVSFDEWNRVDKIDGALRSPGA